MSAYTTLHVSREKAKAFIIDKVQHSDDQTLEMLLDFLLRERLFNAMITLEGKDDPSL